MIRNGKHSKMRGGGEDVSRAYLYSDRKRARFSMRLVGGRKVWYVTLLWRPSLPPETGSHQTCICTLCINFSFSNFSLLFPCLLANIPTHDKSEVDPGMVGVPYQHRMRERS